MFWCNVNRLTINASKTKYLLLKPKCQNQCLSPDLSIKIGNISLERVHSYNYLGVILDDALSFEKFMKEKCKRVNLQIYQLGKLRKFMDPHIANQIYKQTIVSLYDYADFLIESGPKMYIDRLLSLHEKAISIIDYNSHPKMKCKNLQMLYKLECPIRRRHERHVLIMYQLSKCEPILDNRRHKINLRSQRKVKFKHKNRNLERLLKSPYNRGVKIWDHIFPMTSNDQG